MSELARWSFAVGVGLAGGVVGWFVMPLVYVPWLFVRALLRRARRPA